MVNGIMRFLLRSEIRPKCGQLNFRFREAFKKSTPFVFVFEFGFKFCACVSEPSTTFKCLWAKEITYLCTVHGYICVYAQVCVVYSNIFNLHAILGTEVLGV